MQHRGLTAFDVHYVNKRGTTVKVGCIHAGDYWEACTQAFGEGYADFKVFDPREVEEVQRHATA